MSGPVPTATSLADIYPPSALAAEGPRWNALLAKFQTEFGHPARFVSRSPGRVNIIGEHIDYSLYSVLPMAITADAIIAVATKPAAPDAASFTVRVRNVQDAKFPPADFDVPFGGDVDIDSTKFEWTNYFKSGLRGALGLLYQKKGADFRPCDMEVLMDGNVPVGGGLSSSAAFVTASALAVMAANGESAVDKKELTELAIVSERAVGVNSGGMDQAASVFSEQGSATFVSFTPSLSARPHVTGPIHYNLRVVEVSFAAAYLHAKLNPPGTELPQDAGPLGISLQGFHDAFFYHNGGSDYAAAKSLTKEEELRRLIDITKETLTREDGYTREEIASVLQISVPELEQRFMSRFPVRADRFKLRQRALHVFTEALRVVQFLALLEGPLHTGRTDTTQFNEELGKLMNETQDSCRDLYECSCPELDEICRISRGAGAYSSRLTGAGWGGCSVHLVPADKVQAVKEALEQQYYSKLDLTDEQREQAVVVSRPARGSAVYIVEGGQLS
ncbi:hypothetical protein TgHK011_001085 [Trichoderma gracile]|nr:hypothetical protein TgHK011_001085 [Trichoderma gracile]